MPDLVTGNEKVAPAYWALVNPYADWERETRPQYISKILESTRIGGSADPDPILWCPVYVELRCADPDCKSAARQLLHLLPDHTDTARNIAFLRLGVDAIRSLRIIADVGKSALGDEFYRYANFFVLRPENLAYSDRLDGRAGGTLLPYTIKRVGLAIPGSFANVNRSDSGGAINRGTLAQTPVFTAVIDDAIGIANERFRTGDSETRIARSWRQGTTMPDLNYGLPKPAIGAELDAGEINDLLTEANGSDRQFYKLLDKQLGANALFAVLLDIIVTRFLLSGGSPAEFPRTLDEIFGRPESARSAATDGAVIAQAGVERMRGPGPAAAPLHADPSFRRPTEQQATHGTFVLDLAAGWPQQHNITDRPIFAVELPALATAETSGARLDTYILLALLRIFDWADTWRENENDQAKRVPVVINISFGNSAGPKDGTGFMETEVQRLVDARDSVVPTKVVFAAGNAYRERLSAKFNTGDTAGRKVEWCVQPGDMSNSFVEIRISQDKAAKVTLTPPGSAGIEIELSSSTDRFVDLQRNGRVIGRAYPQPPSTTGYGAAFNCLTIALSPTSFPDEPDRTAPAGRYAIEVEKDGADHFEVFVDVQRDDTPSGFRQFGRQSYLDHPTTGTLDPRTGRRDQPAAGTPITRDRSLNAFAAYQAAGRPPISTSGNVFTVGGSYPATLYQDEQFGLSEKDLLAALYTGSGGDLDAKGPDLSARSEDGHATPGRLASGKFSGSAAVFSGTSSAAPQVTRRLVTWLSTATWPSSPADKAQPLKAVLQAGALVDLHKQLGHGALPFAQEPGRRKRRLLR